jgi:hypothetical protein
MLAAGVLLVVAITGPPHVHLRHRHDALNETVVDSIKVYPDGTYGLDLPPGAVGVAGTVGFEVTAPITLIDIRPYRVPDGFDVISRAYFYGFGTSPSGHQMFNGAPGSSCAMSPWPPTGYNRSWPVPGLILSPGDPIKVGFYFRARTGIVGPHTITGYRITYRTAKGKVRTVTGDTVRIEINDVAGGDAENEARAACNMPSVFRPFPGYPN